MTNLEIAQKATLRPIAEIAEWAGLGESEFEPLGRYKAKLTFEGMRRLAAQKPRGRLIAMTAVNPTPAGEGKTTMSVGLAQGLNRLGKKAIPALREHALGPVFGIKGGACGGGHSQVLPMEEINLFFNGDFPAIAAAHNLLSTMLDAHLHQGNALDLDLKQIWWPRTVDMIDRALREIVIGLGKGNGVVRSDGFVITPASEVMATLCMARSLPDLKQRISEIVVGLDRKGSPVRAGDLQASGAMAALLRDAIRPNLVQTIEGGAAVIHGGPFGNIAHGCSSILGTQLGLRLGDFLITEGGFGSDLGGEKLLNIVAPQLDTPPSTIVLVATVRALKHHGGGDLGLGLSNLGRHIEHLKQYGPPVVVALNEFLDDEPQDVLRVLHYAENQNVAAVPANPWAVGGAGCEELAETVASLSDKEPPFAPLYAEADPPEAKIEALVRRAYGGRHVTFSKAAENRLAWAKNHGMAAYPVCVAKTQYSLSDDPAMLGAPQDFDIHVREVRVSAGARFLVAICGETMLMPGMGRTPAAMKIDVDDDGTIHGMY
jgi:formate--tetrahydrofolate ligase